MNANKVIPENLVAIRSLLEILLYKPLPRPSQPSKNTSVIGPASDLWIRISQS